MKTHLLLVTIFISGILQAQTDFRFADSTANWSGRSWLDGMQPSSVDYELRVMGDTSIAGRQYQIINSAHLRKDSVGRVFALRPADSVEALIYDFSKIAGDTFSISDWQQPAQSFSLITIDSTDTVWIGRYRKRMYVNTNGFGGFRTDIWIEDIGALKSYTLNPGSSYHTIPGIDELVCFWEQQQLVYHNTAYPSCFTDLKNDALSNSVIDIFPNPTTDGVFVQNEVPFPAQTSFRLFDMVGRMVLRKPLDGKLNRIELNEVSKGVYLYSIITGSKKIISGKLVAQ